MQNFYRQNFQLHIGSQMIAVHERPGSLPAIVFLHGNSMSAQSWKKQFESPLLAGRHLIAFDLPGHGESGFAPEPGQGYTLPGYAALLNDLLAALKLEQYVLTGFSMGANVVCQALPGLAFCRGAFLTALTLISDTFQPEAVWLPNSAMGIIAEQHPTDEQLKVYMEKVMIKKNGMTYPEFLIQDFKRTDPAARTCMMASVAAGNFSNGQEVIANSPVPVALLLGSEEQAINQAYIEGLKLPLWEHKVHNVSGAGHFCNWENATEFDTLLLRFVGSC
jgi:pimeloyl-ACP methyl ester carboxylesterase